MQAAAVAAGSSSIKSEEQDSSSERATSSTIVNKNNNFFVNGHNFNASGAINLAVGSAQNSYRNAEINGGEY